MASGDEITLEQLMKMKRMALESNNFKEVEKINKIIALKMGKRKPIIKGRKPKILKLLYL